MGGRAKSGEQWAVRLVALIPVVLVAFGCQQSIGIGATALLLVPVAILTGLLCASAGTWVGLVAVLGAGVAGQVVTSVVSPGVLSVIAVLIAASAWAAQFLVASPRPALAVIPPILALVVVLLIGLAGSDGSLVLAVGVSVSLALLLFVVGSWTGAGQGGSAAVVPSAGAIVWSVVALVSVGLVAFAAGQVADVLLNEPPRLVDVSAQRPLPAPVPVDVRDPLTEATRWQTLPNEATRELMTLLPPVRASRPIWISMHQYNGDGWVIPQWYAGADGAIGADPGGSATQISKGRLRIEVGAGLPGPWVPAPQRVTQVLGPSPVRVNLLTGTVISAITPIGQRFEVRYAVPVVTDKQLTSAKPSLVRGDPSTQLPAALPPTMAALATKVAADEGTSMWSRLVALSEALRAKKYTAAPAREMGLEGPGRTLDDYDLVLADRTGFQEQYAAIFALTARSWGIPTRLCIGFLPEVKVSGTVVHGPDTSVWAEARLAGIGWVAFQPSPQDRQAGRPAYVRPTAPQAETASPSATSTGGSTSGSTTSPSPTGEGKEGASSSGALLRILFAVIALAVLVALWLLAVAVLRRRDRARMGRGSAQRSAAGAWNWAMRCLDEAGMRLPPDASPDRVGDLRDRLSDDLPPSVAEPFRALAVEVSPVLYAPEAAVQVQADRAWALASEVENACATGLTPGRRLRRLLVPGTSSREWEVAEEPDTLSETVVGRAPRNS
ncbi:MAG: transglutaminase domain-containing protein [Actinomycetes bacterium]